MLYNVINNNVAVKKMNASIRLVRNLQKLSCTISRMPATKFTYAKVNNSMINKVFNLLKSQDARYLNMHSILAYDQFNAIDTNYLDVDYIHNDFNTTYAFKNRLQLLCNVNLSDCTALARHQYINLLQHGYKYTHFSNYTNTSRNKDGFGKDIISDKYTKFNTISRSLLLYVITEIQADASIPHILNVDIRALKINLHTQIFLYHLDTNHHERAPKLNDDKHAIEIAKKRLSTFIANDRI